MSYPLLMQAPVKDYIWGGTKLREKYSKVSEADKLAESWELSCHQDGPSIIANGPAKGRTLEQYIEAEGREILGSKAQSFENFPIMIKLIDAKDNLSVQVHPDNEYALKNEGEYGKTEMWYIIDAEPGAELLYGVEKKITADELAESLQNGTITDICHHAPVKKGDVFFIPAGTIHAIGKGILLAEVQQNSNTTYRLYDYGRLGNDGKPRQLHVKQGSEVSSLEPLPLKDEREVVALSPDCNGELLASCDYFTTYGVQVDGTASLVSGSDSFQTFTVLEGSLTLTAGDTLLEMSAGQTVFLPAGMGGYTLDGKAHLIFTTL
ncbi:type I phosphomannose isomerase catalytic subunit [Anaerovibrio sp.]|uniref:type I phosphomannose isomerase catalytic subunit n=1 Tax=Anaerovibrio sp. TaxID=1872532 RepID=UPI003F1763AD